ARMPRVLGFDEANRLLCMEDLGAGADFTDVYRTRHISREELEALVSWLGALHALELDERNGIALSNHAMRELNHAHLFQLPFCAPPPVDLDGITTGLAELHRALASNRRLVATAHELGEIYLGRGSHGSTEALLHGDYYPGSWLRNERLRVAIIDPEVAVAGAPEFDVGVFHAHLTFAGFDTAEVRDALARYERPRSFSDALARAFAGVELIRRLLGVAQLPLTATLETKHRWLEVATRMVLDARRTT